RRAGAADLAAAGGGAGRTGREARGGRAVRAAELGDAALGVDAAALGVRAHAGRAGAGGAARRSVAAVVLRLPRAWQRAHQLLGPAGGERQLDVERGRRRVAERIALARQQVEALAGDDHLAVHPAVLAGLLRRARALADAPDVTTPAGDVAARTH